MSRSFKKTAGWTYENSNHISFEKRQANKKVRKMKEIPDGRAYKKIFDTWNIRDTNHRFYNNIQIREYINLYDKKRYKMFIK